MYEISLVKYVPTTNEDRITELQNHRVGKNLGALLVRSRPRKTSSYDCGHSTLASTHNGVELKVTGCSILK